MAYTASSRRVPRRGTAPWWSASAVGAALALLPAFPLGFIVSAPDLEERSTSSDNVYLKAVTGLIKRTLRCGIGTMDRYADRAHGNRPFDGCSTSPFEVFHIGVLVFHRITAGTFNAVRGVPVEQGYSCGVRRKQRKSAIVRRFSSRFRISGPFLACRRSSNGARRIMEHRVPTLG